METDIRSIIINKNCFSGKTKQKVLTKGLYCKKQPASVFCSTVWLVFLSFFILRSEAQDLKYPKLGFCLDSYLSGNGYGTYYTPSFYVCYGKGDFSIGPGMQKCSKKVNCIKATYSYKIANSESDNSQLKGLVFIQYLNNALLSDRAAKREEILNSSDENIDWNSVSYSTIEGGVGFQLNFKVTRYLYWKNYISTSLYYHTNYIECLYNGRKSMVMGLGTGLQVLF